MAMDYPRQVSGLVLIAPTLSPDLEKPRWYERIADCGPVRALLPTRLRLARAELAPLPTQLHTMQERWGDLKVPVTVIQGGSDGQVDPRTADYAEQQLPEKAARILRVEGQGHRILWNNPKLVVDAILSTLDRAESRI
jgi:pimeloyl-ACP methyl ester carboxylesterase